ncbi:CLUMA_CG013018, isoform A [Clunio marinus]|uniref:CLUMA_CG013018, isoform A n=1 Tax=Clunio marinus TaxID=568069 RepID=A0A1J1IJN7_9DIPT|nr:CLUMA_CG013018, isoform A [Clunio marinus]
MLKNDLTQNMKTVVGLLHNLSQHSSRDITKHLNSVTLKHSLSVLHKQTNTFSDSPMNIKKKGLNLTKLSTLKGSNSLIGLSRLESGVQFIRPGFEPRLGHEVE